GCTSNRSISNAGPRGGGGGGSFGYAGELSEFDVLGIERDKRIREDEIAAALDRAVEIAVPKGSSMLLIQSGAVFPDNAFVDLIEEHVRVVPFTGVPERVDRHDAFNDSDPEDYFNSL